MVVVNITEYESPCLKINLRRSLNNCVSNSWYGNKRLVMFKNMASCTQNLWT